MKPRVKGMKNESEPPRVDTDGYVAMSSGYVAAAPDGKAFPEGRRPFVTVRGAHAHRIANLLVEHAMSHVARVADVFAFRVDESVPEVATITIEVPAEENGCVIGDVNHLVMLKRLVTLADDFLLPPIDDDGVGDEPAAESGP